MSRHLVRSAALSAIVVSLVVLPSTAESKPKPKFPNPSSFKIDAPFAMGKVDLKDSILDGKEKWGGDPKCKVKDNGTTCKWGGPKNEKGMALMFTTGDINSPINTILITFGEKANGEPDINLGSPLTKFVTTRGSVSLGAPSQKVPNVDPDIIDQGSQYVLVGKDGARMIFLTGGPNDKFVTGIALTNDPL